MKLKAIFTGVAFILSCHLGTAEDGVRLKWSVVSALESEQRTAGKKGATLAAESIRNLNEMEKLVGEIDKGKDGQSVAELMTTTQATKFGELRQKQKYYSTMSLIVSKRDRDITVLRNLLLAAYNEFEWGRTYVGEDDFDKTVQLLAYIDSNLSAGVFQTKSIPDANDAVSLSFNEQIEAVSVFFRTEVEAGFKEFLTSYRQRTGKSEVTNDNLLPEDMAWGSKLSETKRFRRFLPRLIALHLFYNSMTASNRAIMEEALESGGEFDTLGKKFDEKVEKEWDPPSQHMIGFYNVMNELVPCQLARDLDETMSPAKAATK